MTTKKRFAIDELTLPVSEIFLTVQGEGPSVGKPAIFLRLGGCNLTCTWCDTPYTWDGKRYNLKDELKRTTLRDILDKIESLRYAMDYSKPILVVTGGEPLLHQHVLSRLLFNLSHLVNSIEVETNGTLPPNEEMRYHVDQWNVSPKLSNSGRVSAFEFPFDHLSNRSILKFVCKTATDLYEVEGWFVENRNRANVKTARVYIQPEGITSEQIAESSKQLVEGVIKHGWTLGTRLHVTTWGAIRGV